MCRQLSVNTKLRKIENNAACRQLNIFTKLRKIENNVVCRQLNIFTKLKTLMTKLCAGSTVSDKIEKN